MKPKAAPSKPSEDRPTDGPAAPAVTRVTVLDEPFGIQSAAEPEYTRRVASHVDGTLRALRQAVPTMEPFPTAVLGAMEITDALFRAREAAGLATEDLVARIERLTLAVDAVLSPEGEKED
ncbi:MAG: cell division protein ZapA [Gemmatimonadota bacterium]